MGDDNRSVMQRYAVYFYAIGPADFFFNRVESSKQYLRNNVFYVRFQIQSVPRGFVDIVYNIACNKIQLVCNPVIVEVIEFQFYMTES